MDVLKPGEKLLAKETDYSSGSIGWFGGTVNDAYDLYLAEELNKNLILIIFMKIQFFFEDTKGQKWTTPEKQQFTNKFERAINTTWGNKRVLKTLTSGKKVYLDFRFESLIEGWSVTEHWEVNVKKIKKGGFSQSYVNALSGNVSLDSEDLAYANKPNGVQRGLVHEFGHMLGLDDEYEVGSTHEKDYSSILNNGETIQARHDSVYTKWLNKILKKKGVN